MEGVPMAAEPFLRWLKIMTAIQAKPGISKGELARKCEVSERTIYRDIDRLSTILPITQDGHGGGYRFTGYFSAYPLNLTDEEVVGLSIIPSIIDPDKLPPGFTTAYDKIMATHYGEQKKGQTMLEQISELIQTGKPAYRPESGNYLSLVIQAMLESRTLHTQYHTQYRNVTSERLIDPYYLVPREQRFYLIAFCHREKRVRTFRLSRFLWVEMTEQRFDRGAFNMEKYMKHTWSIHRGDKQTTFRVKFSPNVARYVKEEELFVRPLMKSTKEGGLIFQVTVNNEDEFVRWLLQYGPDAEILSPDKARNAMIKRLRIWEKVYGNQTND